MNNTRRLRILHVAPLHPPLGSCCWIGAHVVLTAGSVIGKGSLIAAGAVVTHKIDSDVLAGGTPAHFLKELHDGEDREE